MTKLLTIDSQFYEPIQDYIYKINVIADNQENIIILKDLIEDQKERTNMHCIKIKLNHCFQQCCQSIPRFCTKGCIYIRCQNQDITIEEAINNIARLIQNFIQ